MSNQDQQFPVTRFARGVKVTTDHVYSPLSRVSTAASSTGVVNAVDNIGTTRVTWVLPWTGAEAVQESAGEFGVGYPMVVWPFTMPPFQQLFVNPGFNDPIYLVKLAELSLSFDQRAEPYGLNDPNNGASAAGQLTDCGMSRYDMILRLCERTPYKVSGDTEAYNEVVKIELPGEALWGGATRRQNPLLITDLDVAIKPFSVYFWSIECPKLWTADAASAQLALVSLTLQAAFTSPLTTRDRTADFAAPGVQNIPTKTNGDSGGMSLPVTTPVANTQITGSDIQDQFHVFDKNLREGAPSGYGPGYGANANVPQAADRSPEEILTNDAHYCMITVPMWTGFGVTSVQAEDVPSGWLPYTTGAALWKDPAFDQRVLFVPDNFVLHHAFVVDTILSPLSTLGATHTHLGRFSAQNTYVQEVGVIITSGWQADEYHLQNAAYLTWNGGAPAPETIDRYTIGGTAVYDMLGLPIVSDAPDYFHSWVDQGVPFFMGTANNSTEARSLTATVGGVTAYPDTNGRENMLVVRWSKQDSTNGLNDALDPYATRAGQGGSWVILCGKIVAGA